VADYSVGVLTVAFFISGHGFGHASREVEVVNALLGDSAVPVDVILRTSADPALLARTVRGPYRLLPGPCDPGIVQRDSVTHDDDASVTATRAFYREFDRHADDEVRRLDGLDVSLIVGDIPPAAFSVAARLGVPSLAIANFTWDWIYETMPGLGDDSRTLASIRDAYRLATRALALPFAGGMDVFPRCESLPLIARHASRTRGETRRQLEPYGVDAVRPMALLSFGGYGLPGLAIDRLPGLADWSILSTDRTAGDSRALPGVITIPESIFLGGDLRYEDLVAAADVVITKPGFGIIAECAANDTPLVYTSRGAFREYDVLVAEMPRYVRCAFLPPEDLRGGRWREAIDRAMGAARPPRPRSDGAAVAAGVIREMLAGGARSGRTPAAR
jgi:L-arabinokinase